MQKRGKLWPGSSFDSTLFEAFQEGSQCVSRWVTAGAAVHRCGRIERLLLELKGKLGADFVGGVAINRPKPVASDVMNALLALGYNDREAAAALKGLPPDVAVGEGIKLALRALSR